MELMPYADISIKAVCSNPGRVEQTLTSQGAVYVGEDLQCDTYYQVPIGKMKLREGNIENLLTHYLREEQDGQNRTTVYLYERSPSDERKQVVLKSLKTVGQVRKKRKIYYIDNVKFHLDRFEDGKTYVEIEAIDRDGSLGMEHILSQARHFRELLEIDPAQILKDSYIDLG